MAIDDINNDSANVTNLALLQRKMAAAAVSAGKKMRRREDEAAGFTVAQMPDKDAPECIKFGTVSRQVTSPVGGLWVSRSIALTADCIHFGLPADDSLMDTIQLLEITHLECPHAAQTKRMQADPLQGKAIMRVLNTRRHDSQQNIADELLKQEAFDEDEADLVLIILSAQDIEGSGRPTTLKFESAQMRDAWHVDLEAARVAACERRTRELDTGALSRLQRHTLGLFNSNLVQYTVGLVILSSFFLSVYAAQYRFEPGTAEAQTIKVLEYLFSAVFAAELCINMFANWFWPFFSDGWSVFDLVVVAGVCVCDNSHP